MAFTYRWQDVIDQLKQYSRNIPLDKVSAVECDSVSSEIWHKYPFKDSCQTYPSIILQDSISDYDPPPNYFRLVSAQITRTAPSADTYDPLSIVQELPLPSAIAVHPIYIRSIAFIKGLGRIRFSFLPIVNTNEAYQCDGQYQMEHNRVSDLGSYCWFSDSLMQVALEGILYWGYKLGNQFKYAEVQMKVFQAKIAEAWQQETRGTADVLVPEVTLGADFPFRQGY